MKKEVLDGLMAAYWRKPRKDSPKRWLRRITKPKCFRYQSLLRGAFKAKRDRLIQEQIARMKEIQP